MNHKPTIIITGASRGLGAAAARIVGERGANVVLNARSEGDLKRVAEEIDPTSERVLVVPGDVSEVETARRLVRSALGAFGRLDGLINNAGVLEPIAPLAQADPERWQKNLLVNAFGPALLTHFALPHLRQQGGRVISVSSGAAVSAVAGWSAYCAGKAALNHLTRVLAVEEPEVTFVALRPGVVDTEMQAEIRRHGEEGMPAEKYQRFVRYHKEGELLPPELPGEALAVLALRAPAAWSGEFVQWDEARVQALVAEEGG